MIYPPHLRCAWYPACLARRLGRRPLARTVLDTHLALFRDAMGRPGALLDRCPHRNAPLSQGRVHDSRLVCPYHGWEFDRSGACRAIPGSAGGADHSFRTVPTFPVVEVDQIVWVWPSADAPVQGGPPALHRLDQPRHATLIRAFTLEGALLDVVENFLDATHTHFVHAGLVRSGATRRPVQAIVRRARDHVEAEYLDEGRQSGLIPRLMGGGITRTSGRFLLPATIQLEYRAEQRVVLRITLYVTPRMDDRHEVVAVLTSSLWPLLVRILSVPLGWLLWRVVAQDQRILTMQAANLRRFGEANYRSTELDLLRPHVARLLQDGPQDTGHVPEKRVTLML